MGYKSKQLFISTPNTKDKKESKGSSKENYANMVSIGNPDQRKGGLVGY